MVYRYGDRVCPGDFVELGSSNEGVISSVLYGEMYRIEEYINDHTD